MFRIYFTSVISTIGLAVLPIIIVAETTCWFAVITLNHLGHAIEELLWATMVTLFAAALIIYSLQVRGSFPGWVLLGLFACAGTTSLMMFVDVPSNAATSLTQRNTGDRKFSG